MKHRPQVTFKGSATSTVRSLRLCLAIAFIGMLISVPTGSIQQVSAAQPSEGSAPNILVIVADDMGIDTLSAYGVSRDAAVTPNLDKLAKDGVLFNNVWATPACSPTRAALLTGQYGRKNGVTRVPGNLPVGSRLLHAAAGKAGYANALFGKWHLSGRSANPGHPNTFAIEHFVGNAQHNLPDYFGWDMVTNGKTSQSSTYHTTQITSETINWINDRDKPWLAWVAYSAPHAPFHKPPAELHSRNLSEVPARGRGDVRPHYLAAIEAMDHEIGRLLDSIPENEKTNTLIVFVGDNGTPRRVIDQQVFARNHGKSTLYEGGIRVPFIVAGAGIAKPGRTSDDLVNVVDLFPTLAELFFGSVAQNTDGVSFAKVLQAGAGHREYNYAEYDGGWTVRDGTHKFIRQNDGQEELYLIDGVIDEQGDLMGRQQAQTIASKLRDYGLSLRNDEIADSSPAFAGRSGSASPVLQLFGRRSTDCADYEGSFEVSGTDIARRLDFASSLSVTSSANACTFASNSIPNHDFNDGHRAFPNETRAVQKTYLITRSPKLAATPTPLSLLYGNAILLNGVNVDVMAAGCFNVGNGRVGCNDMSTPWRYNPLFEKSGFNTDSYDAHTQSDGTYHYHGTRSFISEDATVSRGVIGFAADGFPIYASMLDASGKPVLARSSYRVKQGRRPSGEGSPGGSHDGTFLDDFEYVAGSGDLDQCNGAMINGQYAYFATPTYPYWIGCYSGTPDPSFAKRANARGGRAERRRGLEQAEDRGQGRRNGERRRRQQRD